MEFPALTDGDLVSSLEQATLMAKQLPSTTDPSQVYQISSSLQNAHHQLSLFLSRFHSSQPHHQAAAAAENSPSSVIGGEGEPMQLEDDDGDEQLNKEEDEEVDSRVLVENVEERMKNCFLQSKRRKRNLSPSSIAVEQALRKKEVQEFPVTTTTFNPQATRLRSLELIYQFHG